jgi:iron complex outermembrane receptor protein
MYKSISCLVFLFILNTTFSQVRQFVIRTGSVNAPCDSLYKEIGVFTLFNEKDSLIMRASFFECELKFFINSPDSLFRIIVTNENNERGQIEINTNAFTDSIVDLGYIDFKPSTRHLDEFTITGIRRKFIRIDADKKIVTVKDNPVLTTSSVYDAILKIPGVVPFPGGGFAVNGQLASVYFENVPSSLAGDDLLNFLRSLPATSVETIEIISNPGASYDANLSGGIINIISMAKVSKYISGTITMNYGLNENNKIQPSFMLSGMHKKLTWQFQLGYSYLESSFKSLYSRDFNSFDPQIRFITERKGRSVSRFLYFMPSLTYSINSRSSLILNYSLSQNNIGSDGASQISSEGAQPAISASNDNSVKGGGINHGLTLKYRLNIDTLRRVFSATANYSGYQGGGLTKTAQFQNSGNTYSLIESNLNVQRLYVRTDLEIPFDSANFYLSTGIKISGLFASNNGRYNLQNASLSIFDNPTFNSNVDFDYDENNFAAYVDLKKGFGQKFTIGAGIRAENFTLNRRSNFVSNVKSNYFNFFPSANAIYRLYPNINFITTYSRKISIPSYSQFDPNNTGYYDSYSSSVGNVFLQPNFYDNFEIKATVFDYLEVSMSYSHSSSLNLGQTIAELGSLTTIQTFRTYKNVNVASQYFALPIPFSFFIKGKKFFEEPLDIENLSYVYLYASRTKTDVSGLELQFENRALWYYGLYSQFILPWKLKLYVNAWLGDKGTYLLSDFTRQRSGIEAVISREFYKRKLRVSASINDIFNQDQNTLRTSFPNIDIINYSKNDTRIVWLKVSYSFGKYEKAQGDGPKIGRQTQQLPQ